MLGPAPHTEIKVPYWSHTHNLALKEVYAEDSQGHEVEETQKDPQKKSQAVHELCEQEDGEAND